jgi:hypothetical protein
MNSLPSRSRLPLLLACAAFVASLALTGAACRTTRRAAQAPAEDAQPIHSTPRRAWRLLDGERLAGWVISFREEAGGEREFYSVRNEFQQELGLIDALGRAWRYRPFEERPEHIATSTVVEGARAILGASSAARLVEVSLAELEISR